MYTCPVGERILNEFLESDEQLSPGKKAELDAYLSRLTEHVSSRTQSTTDQSTKVEQAGSRIVLEISTSEY